MWTISGEYGEACGWKRCRTDCGRNKCFVVGNIGKEKACMELEALVLDINYGKNKKLMEACHPLKEYAYFVEKVNIKKLVFCMVN